MHRLALLLLLPACGPKGDDSGDPAGCTGDCPELCGNGLDDDGDGRADCLDATCGWMCPEDCANGVDDDGDWIVDCADESCSSTCDGDGDGVSGPQVGGGDCDDDDDTVYPGATEIYHDGADNDCDPTTADDDEDADGFPLGVDCSDTNPDTFPGAEEVCGDGEVNDCDAPADPPVEACYGARSLGTADFQLQGVVAGGEAGYSAAGVGDVDGDGFNDVLVGAAKQGPVYLQGAAYLVHGPLPERYVQLRPGACELAGEGEEDWAGSWVGVVGDLDADGLPDAAVGARYQDVPGENAGRIYIIEQPCASGDVGANAVAVWGEAHDELGTVFTGGADVTGDGFDDLVAGAPLRDRIGQPDKGAVFVFAGPITNVTSTPEAHTAIYGSWGDGLAGTSVVIPGDVDGDGLADLAAGAPLASPLGVGSGEAYVFTDLVANPYALVDDAHAILAAGDDGDHFGQTLGKVGDLTGDGRGEVCVGAPDSAAGTVWIFDAGALPTVLATLEGAAAGDAFGSAIAGLRDRNGDLEPDVAISAEAADGDGVDAGAVYVFFGPLAGTIAAADADVTFLGEAANDYAGYALASGGDLDGDGLEDLLVGSPYRNTFGDASGTVYVLTFGW